MTTLADDLVPEELWALVAPLLPAPPRPPYGGRHRTISDRACFAAIVYMARTSTPWRLLPARELGCGSPATCWRRLAEWANAGVFDALHLVVLEALLHLDDPRQGVVGPTVFGSNRQGEVVERDGQPLAGRHLDRQLIVASPDVLHERMTGNDDPGATVLLESSHRSQSCLQAAVIGLDPVVGVPLGAVPGRRQQVLQHDRVGRLPLGR
jgi:transposase